MGMHNRISSCSKRAPIPIAACVVGMLLIPPAHADFAGLVEIGGGRHIYLDCRARAAPRSYSKPATVVPGGSGAATSARQERHGRWFSRACPVSHEFALMIDRGP